MKILSISYLDIWPSGEGKSIPSIFIAQSALVKRGHEAYFICPAKTEASGYVNYQGIHIYRFKLPFNISVRIASKPMRLDKFFSRLKASILYNFAWLFFQILSFITALKLAKKFKPQIVYSHDITPAFPAWLVSRLCSAKFVLRIYGTRILYWHYKNLFLRLKEFRDYACLKLPADYIIATKDGTHADLLLKELGVKEEKIKYWRNGVDLDIYDPDPGIRKQVCQKLGINPEQKIIISTSRLIPFYSLDRLVDKLPELFKLNPQCAVIIASDGPQRDKLEEFVRRSGIGNKVFFVGMVSRGYLKELLNASDLFITLSSFSNCNNSLYEAMVCAKPILALENESIKELINSGQSGCLIKENELNNLAQSLNRILRDDNLLIKLGTNARNSALKNLYSWEKRMDLEAQLLESLT